MSSSGKAGSNGGSFYGSNRGDNGNGSGSKFQNKNISGSFKSTTGGNTRSPAGMTVVRGNKGVGKAIGGAAAPTATVAPIPLNTPSVRRENNGRDPSVNLVPSRTAAPIWGQGTEEHSPEIKHSAPSAPVVSKPAPWAKPAQSGGEAGTEDTAKPAPAPRVQSTNWADVEVDSDEDDSPPTTSPVVPQTAPQHSRPAEPTHAAPSFTQSPYNQGLPGPQDSHGGFRRERSGSGSGSFPEPFGDQRRFGGFGAASYGQQQQDDGRFGPRGNFPSGDVRFGGPVPNDFGRPQFGGFGLHGGPAYGGLNGGNGGPALRGSPAGFGGRPGPDRSFGHMPPPHGAPSFATSQRPPVGEFSARGSGGSFGQSTSIFGHGSMYGGPAGGLPPAPPSSDPNASDEQRAIEAARYEADLLEARKQRKRTMSSEDPHFNADSNQGLGQQQQRQQQSYDARERDFPQDGRASFGQSGQVPSYGFGGSTMSQRREAGTDGAPRLREDPFGGMGGRPAAGPPAGLGYGAERPRIPQRTRGPAEESPQGGGFGPRGGFPGGGFGGYDLPHSGTSSEPMWERVKRPEVPPPNLSTNNRPPQGLSAGNPFMPPDMAGTSSAGDRWNARQPLPPPPALQMNSPFMNLSNPSMMNVQQSGRERGPQMQGQGGPRPAHMVGGDEHRNTSSPSVDPNRPFSSLFHRAGADSSRAPTGEHVASRDEYPDVRQADNYRMQQQPPPQQHQGRPGYAPGQGQEYNYRQQHSAVQYDAEHREPPPASTPPGAASNRPKMLFDPASNKMRELATSERELASKQQAFNAAKNSQGRHNDFDRKPAGPPAQEVVDPTTVTRKTLQVNRIEQNTGEKWTRQTLPKEASTKDDSVSRSAPPAALAATTTSGMDGVVVEDHDEEPNLRQEYLDARKEARTKERMERGPRTKGFLFRYNAEGQIERVFTPEEKVRADALKARKAEKAERERRLAGDAPNPLAVASVDDLPLRLSAEQFKALTPEQKEALKARQAEARAAREHKEPREPKEVGHAAPEAAAATASVTLPIDTALKLTAEQYRALTKEQKAELKARQQEEKLARKAARDAARRERGEGRRTTHEDDQVEDEEDVGELDVRQMTLDGVEEHARRGASNYARSNRQQQDYGHAADRDDAGWQREYQHNEYTNQSSINVPMYAEQHGDQWARGGSSYTSYAGAPEPALFGGNTSFLGVQETSLGSRFAALTTRGDEEGAGDFGGRGPGRGRGGRGRGGRGRGGPPIPYEKDDTDGAVPSSESQDARQSRGGRGRGRGRGSDAEEHGPGDEGAGAGGRGRGRGRGGRGDAREGSGDGADPSYGGRGGRGRGRGRGAGRSGPPASVPSEA